MRFTLKQMTMATAIASAVVSYSILDGPEIAILFAILAMLAWYCVQRIFKRWDTLNSIRRFYGLAVAIGSVAFLMFFCYMIATDAKVSRFRTARWLDREFAASLDFRSIEVTYHAGKMEFVQISGSVKTDCDFELLMQKIRDSNWRGVQTVRLNIIVEETGLVHDEEVDHEFFHE